MKEEYSSYKFSEDFHLMNTDKKFVYEMIEAVISFLCFYPLLAFIIFIVNQSKDDVLDGVLLLVPILAMVYIKKKVKNLALFLTGVLVISAAGTVFLWTDSLRIYHFVFLLCYGIYFIVKRIKKLNLFWRFGNLAAMNIFIAFIYGFTLINDISLLKKLTFSFAILHLMLSFVYFHFSSTTKLLLWEKYEDKKQAKHLKTINVMFSILIIIILGTIIFIISQGEIFRWLDALNKSLYNGIFKAMNLATTSQSEFMDMEESPMFVLPELDGVPANTSPLFKFTVLFIKFIFVAVIVIDAAVILITLFQKLYNRYIRRLNTDEKVESTLSAQDIGDSLKRSFRRPAAAIRKAIYKTNKEKLRRLYYQAVMNYKRKGASIEQWNTPYEIETNISVKHKVHIEGITELYEKFRYTEEEPTNQELKEMKNKISESIKRGR